MASAEREPIMGVWGRSPQRGPGAEPLAGVQEGEAPLKLKACWFLLVLERPTERQNLSRCQFLATQPKKTAHSLFFFGCRHLEHLAVHRMCCCSFCLIEDVPSVSCPEFAKSGHPFCSFCHKILVSAFCAVMSKSIRLIAVQRHKILGEHEQWPALPCQKLGSAPPVPMPMAPVADPKCC